MLIAIVNAIILPGNVWQIHQMFYTTVNEIVPRTVTSLSIIRQLTDCRINRSLSFGAILSRESRNFRICKYKKVYGECYSFAVIFFLTTLVLSDVQDFNTATIFYISPLNMFYCTKKTPPAKLTKLVVVLIKFNKKLKRELNTWPLKFRVEQLKKEVDRSSL